MKNTHQKKYCYKEDENHDKTLCHGFKNLNESIYLWEHKAVIWEAWEAIVWLRKQMQRKLIEGKEKEIRKQNHWNEGEIGSHKV